MVNGLNGSRKRAGSEQNFEVVPPWERHVGEVCQVGYKKEEEGTRQTWAYSSVKTDSELRVFALCRWFKEACSGSAWGQNPHCSQLWPSPFPTLVNRLNDWSTPVIAPAFYLLCGRFYLRCPSIKLPSLHRSLQNRTPLQVTGSVSCSGQSA